MKQFWMILVLANLIGAAGRIRADEAAAVAALKKIGGTVLYTDNDPQKPVRSLYLPGPKIVDADLQWVAKLTDLLVLKLDAASNVTDAGLKELGALKNLQDLGLGSTKVTNAGLKHLNGFKNLQKLNLNFDKITDAGLDDLASLKKLETLGLSFTEVTPEGVKKLQSSLPKCMIIR